MNNVKYKKSRNLLQINEKSTLIRPFSIETIARGIKCENMINSLKYKYIDPKIKRNIEKISKTKKLSKKIQDKLDEEMYSARKIQYRKYKLKKEAISNPLSFREIRKKNKLFNSQNKEIDLPLIIKNKKINQSYKENKEEKNDLITTCGMINRKRLNDNKKIKLTINSLLISLRNKNKKSLINENYKSLDNIYNINNKHFVKKELKKNNINITKKIKLKRQLTKTGLLTNLYHKYSSVSNIYINANKKNNMKKKEKLDNDDNSSNNSYDLGKELSIINSNNSRGYIFLTKLKGINDNIDISRIINRHNNLIWSIKKNNNKIIDSDNKIYINCLLSKVQSEIKRDKIVYKNIGKTIYELDKESSYNRLKKFENIINKFIVENY